MLLRGVKQESNFSKWEPDPMTGLTKTIMFFSQDWTWKLLLQPRECDRRRFHGELTLFRESTYPGMMLGQELTVVCGRTTLALIDGHLRYVTVPTLLTMKQYRGIQERRKVINRVILSRRHNKNCGCQSWSFDLRRVVNNFFGLTRWSASRVTVRGPSNMFSAACCVALSMENILVALYAIFGIALIVASVLGSIEYIFAGTSAPSHHG